MSDLNLKHPVCVICGQPWSYLPDEYQRPDKMLWCCASHDTLWYYQDTNGEASFDLEIDNLYGFDYQVRWNCHCMVEECRGKNIILLIDEDQDNRIIMQFDIPLPYDISREELDRLISHAQDEEPFHS
jgi:hypothetical protein